MDETYPWYGVHARATNRCNGARIALTYTPGKLAYTLEVRAFPAGISTSSTITFSEMPGSREICSAA